LERVPPLPPFLRFSELKLVPFRSVPFRSAPLPLQLPTPKSSESKRLTALEANISARPAEAPWLEVLRRIGSR